MLITMSIDGQSLARRYLNGILNDTSDVSRPQLLIYPTLSYAPETSWEVGFSSLYVYYAKGDTTNRLSEVYGFTFITLESQYGLWFDHAIYTDKDRWFFLGRLRFQSFPLYYHGIGIDSPKDYTARVDANQIIIKERVLRKVKNNLFFGLELDFQRLAAVDFLLVDPVNDNFELPLGAGGSENIGLGIGLVQDDRHNVLNVRKGFFSELALMNYNTSWGGTYNFTSVLSDTRVYRPVGKNNVLAAQLLGHFNFGDVPFNQLSLMGGESLMRGYYYGRYRDNHQLSGQIEFRQLPIPFKFTNRIGAAVFVGAGTVFNHVNNLNFSNFVVSGGGGLRFLIFPKKDIWTRLDFAFNREGSGFYFFIGEAF